MIFAVIIPFSLFLFGLSIYALLMTAYMICHLVWFLISYPFRHFLAPGPSSHEEIEPPYPWTSDIYGRPVDLYARTGNPFPRAGLPTIRTADRPLRPTLRLTLRHHLIANPQDRWRTSYE